MDNQKVVQVPLPLKGWEQATRIALGVAGAGIGLVLAYYGLPILAAIFKNGVIALGWGMALAAMGLVVALVVPVIGQLWPFIKHQQRVAALRISEAMVKFDPAGWLKIYLENHVAKLTVMASAITDSSAALRTCVRTRDKKTEERDEARKNAMAALKKNERAVAIRWEKVATRRNESIKRLEKRIQVLEFIVRALKKMHAVLENTIADETDQLNSYIEEFETSKKVEKGIRAGMSALSPDEDQRRIKDTAIATMLSQIDQTHAELEMALDVFQPIITMSDIEDEASLERLNASFEEWERGADAKILGDGGKKLLMAQTLDPMNLLQLDDDRGEPVVLPSKSGGQFDHLIG